MFKIVLPVLGVLLCGVVGFNIAKSDNVTKTPQEMARDSAEFWLRDKNISPTCLDGVLYWFFESDRRAGLSVKYNRDGTIATCL